MSGDGMPRRLPFRIRLAFVLAVVAEIAVVALMVGWLGGWATFWLVLATSLLGGWVIQRAGRQAWSAVAETLRAGRATPAQEVAASATLASSQTAFIGGALLVVPGFLTDLVGALLVLPATRGPTARTLRPLVPPVQISGPGGGPVIEGEVIDPDEPPSRE